MMDLLDLPELGKKWNALWAKIGVDEFGIWLIATTVILLVIVNVPWRHIQQQIGQPNPLSTRDVWLSDAMIYALRGGWGDRIDLTNISENELSRFYEIENEFRQAALDGTLPIWGKRAAYGLWEEVLAKDWVSYEIHEFDLLKSLADPEKLMVVRKGDRFPTQEWVRVKTSKAKVEELWPVGNI